MSVGLWFLGVFGVSACLTAVALRVVLDLRVVERLHPRPRARLIAWSSIAPALVGGLVLLATFTPQTWLGLPDHCLSHHGHLHLCLSCGLPTPPTFVALAAALYGAWLVFGLGRVMAQWVRAHRALGRLARARHASDGLALLPLPGLVAFVAGFLRPRVYVSTSAAEAAWSAVIAHERDHARHLDPLARLLTRLALVVAPPGLDRWLERRLVRAQELAADEAAAHEVGDRLEVATQVLAWARAQHARPPLALGFGDGNVPERVKLLMDAPTYLGGPTRAQLATLTSAIGLSLFSLAPSIHHGVEELVHLLDHH